LLRYRAIHGLLDCGLQNLRSWMTVNKAGLSQLVHDVEARSRSGLIHQRSRDVAAAMESTQHAEIEPSKIKLGVERFVRA